VFVFCNHRRDRIKGLYWDGNGFVLFYKRIERARFVWPKMDGDCLALGVRELSWLLEGQSLRTLRPRPALAVVAV